jgi:hypothetical protein
MPAVAGVRNLYLDDPAQVVQIHIAISATGPAGRASGCQLKPFKASPSARSFLLANDTSTSCRRNAQGVGIKQDDSDAAQRTARETVGGAAGSIRQLVRRAVRPLRRVRGSPRPLPLITGDTVAIETRAAIRDIGYLPTTPSCQVLPPRVPGNAYLTLSVRLGHAASNGREPSRRRGVRRILM